MKYYFYSKTQISLSPMLPMNDIRWTDCPSELLPKEVESDSCITAAINIYIILWNYLVDNNNSKMCINYCHDSYCARTSLPLYILFCDKTCLHDAVTVAASDSKFTAKAKLQLPSNINFRLIWLQKRPVWLGGNILKLYLKHQPIFNTRNK